MRRPRPVCHVKGCAWELVPGVDAKRCARCGAQMTARQVIAFWRAQDAATGQRLTDYTILTHYGWPLIAPRRFRP